MRVVVLGAGLAGLSAAWHLLERGAQVTVVEREAWVGGMARSWRVGPYTLDFGPHRLHSRDPELIRHLFEVLGGEVAVCERRSRIRLGERYFDYPLRAGNVVAKLPVGLLVRAVLDYGWVRVQDRMRALDERDFESWVVKRFGRTLYREFFGVYTEKAWRMPCREISSDWAAQRISQANLWDAIHEALHPTGQARGVARQFYYPVRGGIGELARRYAEQIEARGGRLELGASVERIEVVRGAARGVSYLKGAVQEQLDADHVVATIPLPATLRAVRADGAELLSAEEHAAADGLGYLAMLFAYVEVPRPSAFPDHWIYLPDPALTAHRLSEPKNFCAGSAPADSTVVCCEITCRRGDERWRWSDAQVGAAAVADLERIGVLAPGRGRVIEVARLAHAYPIYDHAYRGRLEILRRAQRRVAGLSSTGRQGLYRYNNMDHSIAMGRKVARALARPDAAEPALPAGAEVAAAAEYFG